MLANRMRVPHCGQVTFGAKDLMLLCDPLADIGNPHGRSAIQSHCASRWISKTNFCVLKVQTSFSNEMTNQMPSCVGF